MTLSAYEKERVLIFYCSGDVIMDETRLAQIGIIVTERKAVSELNGLLSVYGEYIIGRMGLPLKERGVSVISLAPTFLKVKEHSLCSSSLNRTR